MTTYTQRMNRPAAPARRLTLTARGRFVRNALIVLAFTVAVLYFMSGQAADATSTKSHVSFTYVTVMPGDTLWSIAHRVAPTRDPRDWIAETVDLNGLTSSNVIAGSRLALPGN